MLTHAVIDALLGAAGLGDIGEHFPDSDERFRDADSIELLEQVVGAARPLEAGGRIVNVDCTLGDGGARSSSPARDGHPRTAGRRSRCRRASA